MTFEANCDEAHLRAPTFATRCARQLLTGNPCLRAARRHRQCACWLDIQAQQGRIQFWVRNLVRREGSSFLLQKADGRFYPNFLCQLPGKDNEPGPILAVEYKGADRWTAAEDDRLIGDLWANLSDGRCRFVMVKDKRWEWIEEHLK